MKVIPVGAECVVINGAVEFYAWKFKIGERVIIEESCKGGQCTISKFGKKEIKQYVFTKDLKVIALPITKKGRKLK